MTGEGDKQYLLDLLVDGELRDDERRDLLAWCEREPDGWRRCALAFLEAQDWSKVLGDLSERAGAASEEPATIRAELPQVVHAESTQIQPTPTATHGVSTRRIRQWGTMLAMAASVALAFTLGQRMHDAGKAGRIVPDGVGGIRAVDDRGAPADRSPGPVRLVVGGSPGSGEIQLPVMPGDELGSDWLRTQPAAMPDDVRQALERLGHHVEQRRRLVPYRLDDGRRVLVPVDQVEVRPAESRNYQ